MEKSQSVDKTRSIVFLAAALIMTATWSVGATGWTKGLSMVTFVGLGVIVIGLMLARSILPGLIAHLFSAVIGVAWSFWVTTRLLPAHYTWLERWHNMFFRLAYWRDQALQGGTSYDNLMFILQMNVIIWGMGYLTIWFLFRSGRVWQALVPGGLVLLINLYYAPNDITVGFLIYVVLALLLVIRFNLMTQEKKWRSEGVFFRPDISFDFIRDGLIFSVLAIALAWIAPPVVNAKSLGLLDQFQGEWREFQGEWNRLFADLDYRNSTTVDTFGQSLKLGGPRRLTDAPVMDVRVEGVGRYWRAAVYDEYTGTGWRSGDDETASFGPRESLSLPAFEARAPITQTYTFYRDGATVLYAMSNPVGLDRSAKVHFNALANEQITRADSPRWSGAGEPWVEEITYIRSNATVDQGESYQVVSAASQATIEQLWATGTDYPDWVADRYLQLPGTVTERTRELARELAEPYDNPFDKAQAIERYMRAEIKYNEQLTAPPPGVDKVDYILFTAREAYCDYYASSMIVMLRSLGIPARLAVGFARGTFDANRDAFHVINADAHSWVEVFFPQYGWIEFEPTAAQPVIIRNTNPDFDNSFASPGYPLDDFTNLEEFPDRPEDFSFSGDNFSVPFVINLPWLGTTISLPRSVVNGSVAVMGLIMVGVVVGASLWWRRQLTNATESLPNLYQRMVRLASWIGVMLRPWQTPYEHAAILQRRLPSRRDEVAEITHQYVRETFSPHTSQNADRVVSQASIVYESNMAWHRLRMDMIKAAIRQRLPRWLRSRI